MAGLLDEIKKSQYLQMAEQKLQGLLNIPTEAQRFLTNPQAFMSLLGRNDLPKETGFAAGATGLPSKDILPGGVLNPPNLAYQQGYEQGEPFSYAAMVAPMALPVGKALAPKAYDMLENYMTRSGGMNYAIPPDEYRGSHTAPNAKEYGGTLDNLGAIMPEDVYSSRGQRLYGIGDKQIDSEWFSAAYKAKGNPDRLVEVYRAVPKGVKEINQGDWVTTSKTYAKNHGENALNDEYEIISKKVKASTLSSEGYPYEFGYNE